MIKSKKKSIDSDFSPDVIDNSSSLNAIELLLKLVSDAFNSYFDLRFKYRNTLIYFIVENERERLYISTALKQKVFQLIYN